MTDLILAYLIAKPIEIILWMLVAYCVFSPTKYDPAIRLKEWLSRKKGE